MGLLDRVKASQTGAPGAPTLPGPASNGGTPTAVPVLTPPPTAAATATPPAMPTQATPAAPTLATPPARVAPPAPGEQISPAFTAAKVHVHAKLLERYADKLQVTDRAGVREKIQELADEYFRLNAVTMTKVEKDRLVESLLDDVLGLGPLQQLVDDPEITEIMVNHPKQVYVERKGQPML